MYFFPFIDRKLNRRVSQIAITVIAILTVKTKTFKHHTVQLQILVSLVWL